MGVVVLRLEGCRSRAAYARQPRYRFGGTHSAERGRMAQNGQDGARKQLAVAAENYPKELGRENVFIRDCGIRRIAYTAERVQPAETHAADARQASRSDRVLEKHKIGRASCRERV